MENKIDWESIEIALGTHEFCEPEAIIHEIAHEIELNPDTLVFPIHIGNQLQLGARFREKYGEDTTEAIDAEIRTTAITVTVLRTFNTLQAKDPIWGCLRLMRGNLPQKASMLNLYEMLEEELRTQFVRDAADVIIEGLSRYAQ